MPSSRPLNVPRLLHESVDAAAERTPDHPAFVFLDRSITYAELSVQTASFARTLHEQGVRRGDRVALYLNKSLESAIALFGSLRAGAAYVPLDPGAPPDRTRAVLGESAARVAVTHEAKRREAAAVFPGSGVDCVIGLDEAPEGGPLCIPWREALAAPPAPSAAPGASVLDLAYVIFTSGSTGSPKGIMHTHSSGMSYATMAADLYGVRQQDRLSNLSPLHFDMSTFDYLCAPLVGASTVIVPEAYLKLPASLTELAEAERLTIWYSVPFALIQSLLHGAMEERDLTAVRWVLFGGEPFAPKHLEALTRRLPAARFSNVYGPAEVNQCTFYHLPAGWRAESGPPPIGQACRDVDLLVVDESDREVPGGETGELLVRTPTMMSGYWRRPDLNARAFFRQPATGGVDEVYYRTGDLVAGGADGELRFIGRRDHQVKTRGYRVELGEVEAVLVSHKAVAEAAAFAVSRSEGLQLIEAAVRLRDGASETEDAFLSFAAGGLPSYAVPVRIRILESFPRTTSGKIDRNQLSEAAEAESLAEVE